MPRTDVASRFIPAPVGEVFSALVDAEALESWLPPGEMQGEIERFEPWPGGSFKMALRYPDHLAASGKTTSHTDVFDARFIDVSPGSKVSFAVDFLSADDAFGGTMIMTWTVTGTPDGTLVEITADDVPDAISAKDHSSGMESSLEKLAAYVVG